jgi:hypothetical protein
MFDFCITQDIRGIAQPFAILGILVTLVGSDMSLFDELGQTHATANNLA